MRAIEQLDPLWTTALDSLDFGSVYTPDGREHPVTGQTPIYASSAAPTATPPIASGGPSLPSSIQWLAWLFGDSNNPVPPFAWARLIVLIIAIGIILIVAFRLTKL